MGVVDPVLFFVVVKWDNKEQPCLRIQANVKGERGLPWWNWWWNWWEAKGE